MSKMFMEIGRSAPSYQRMALLFPQSKHLQDSVVEYLIRVVQLCHRMLKHSNKSGLAQFFDSMIDGSGADRTELEIWSLAIKDEVEISSRQTQQEEAEKSSKFRFFQKQDNELTRQFQKEANRLRILDAMSTYDYQSTWKQLRKLGNTTVLSSDSRYSSWKNRHTSKTLYLTGQLGAGKSVVLANMVDDLFLSFSEGSALITYFFCRHDVKESLATRTIVGAIARQLLKDEDLSAIPLELIRDRICAGDIVKILASALKPKMVIYVILDGFHDCDTQVQEETSSFIKDLQLSFEVYMCISARLQRAITTSNPVISLSMAMPRDNPDIPNFIEQELERLLLAKVLVIRDPELILEIRDKLAQESRDMFLWVSLQLVLLCSETTDDGIRQMLATLPLPGDLADTYTRLLNLPTHVKSSVRTRFLNLVLAAFRPLTIQEVQESLSVIPGDIDWDTTKMINNLEPIVSACSGLIVQDEEQETIRLVHPSAVQFLQQSSIHFPGYAHEEMAFTIFTYLSYPIFETSLSNTVVPVVDATIVPAGVVSFMLMPAGRVQRMAIRLLRRRVTKQQDVSAILAEQRPDKTPPRLDLQFQYYARRNWFGHLYKAAPFGTVPTKLMDNLIESKKLSLDEEFPLEDIPIPHIGYTLEFALVLWAIEQNYISITRLLLSRGTIDLNSCHDDGLHPLANAVEKGRREIVSLILLNCRVPQDWLRYPEGDPLDIALKRRLWNIASVLLESGQFNPNQNPHGRAMTYLTQAVVMEDIETVKYLLKCPQVDNDKLDRLGRNALHHATTCYSEEVFELLLDTVNVNVVNSNKETASMLAAAMEHRSRGVSRISKLLLKKEFDPNLQNARGETALHIACKMGSAQFVKRLVKDFRVDFNIKDSFSRTPLSMAMGTGFESSSVVRKLVEEQSLDPNLADNHDWTPLHYAALHGSIELVRELIKADGIQVAARNIRGETPADFALQNDYHEVHVLLKEAEAKQTRDTNLLRTGQSLETPAEHTDNSTMVQASE